MGMNSQRFDELENRASRIGGSDELRQLEARSRVRAEIETMKATGEAYELTEEEERMLHAFRRFKLRLRKNGQVFTWQTRMPEGVQLVTDTAEIVTPSEASR